MYSYTYSTVSTVLKATVSKLVAEVLADLVVLQRICGQYYLSPPGRTF